MHALNDSNRIPMRSTDMSETYQHAIFVNLSNELISPGRIPFGIFLLLANITSTELQIQAVHFAHRQFRPWYLGSLFCALVAAYIMLT